MRRVWKSLSVGIINAKSNGVQSISALLSRLLVDTPNLAPYTHFLNYVALDIEVAFSVQVRRCDPRRAINISALAHALPQNNEREALR